MRPTAIKIGLFLLALVTACRSTSTEPQKLVGCRGLPDTPPSVIAAHPTGGTTSRVGNLAGRPFGIRISNTGVVYATQQDANSVARFRLDDATPVAPVAVGGDPGDVVFAHDGRTAFVSNFFDGTVNMLDVASGTSTRLLLVDPQNAYRLAISPDDSLLYVTSTTGRVYAVDVLGHAPTIWVQLSGALQGIAVARDGLSLSVGNTGGGLWRLNACTLAIEGSTTVPAMAQDLALSPDGTLLYVASEAGSIEIVNATTLQRSGRLQVPTLSPFGLAITPDGAQLYVTSPTSGEVGVVDAATGSVVRTLSVGGVPRRVAFDASGSTAVVSNEGNWVDILR